MIRDPIRDPVCDPIRDPIRSDPDFVDVAVVTTGVGSYQLTLPPGVYFRSQLNCYNSCFRFHQHKNSFPLVSELI